MSVADPKLTEADPMQAVDASGELIEPDGGWAEAEAVEPAEVVEPDHESRAWIVAECERRLIEEGSAPFAAQLLANVYATSYELEKMLSGLDQLGGVSGLLGGVFGKLAGGGRKRRKGGEDE